VVTAPRPDPRAAALIAPSGSDGDGSTSVAREASAATSAMAEKATEVRTTDESTVSKAVEEVVTAKVAEEAVEKMVADEATVKTMADEATTKSIVKTADLGAVGMKATMKSAGSGSGPSPALAVGTMRAAASSGSTPPSKRFLCAWKPWYAEQLLSHFVLFVSIHLQCI
jgi:hypothetical protein